MTRAQEIISRLKVKHGDGSLGVRGGIAKGVEFKETASGREITAIATTDDVDLDNEVVLPSGADPESYFFSNKKIFVDHQYDSTYCVGSLRTAEPVPSKAAPTSWKVTIALFSGLRSPLADDIWTMARDSGIGLSIGFRPVEVGPLTTEEARKYGGSVRSIVRAWEWLELSFTAFPCNVSCQTMEATEAPTGKEAAILELVTKGRIRKQAAAAFGVHPAIDRSRVFMPKRKTIVVVGA